jgi:diguanylate cyclase (GGDEF)-like protein/PAS domain S-box-containing protein
MLESIGDAVVSADKNGTITYMNRAAEAMSGWSRADAAGRPFTEVLRIVDRETRAVARNPMGVAIELNTTVGLTPNSLLVRRDGGEIPIEDSASPIRGADGRVTGAVMVFRDVGPALGMTKEMAYQAQHDVLTGLPNRLLMSDRLTEAIALARRNKTLVAVLFVDVDGFKHINDSLGHTAADQILRGIATRLRDALRCSDTVSRYGGDEFVIVLPEIEQADDVSIVCAAIMHALAPVHVVGPHRVTVTVSVGASLFPEHADDASALVATADAAMYEAKRTSAGCYRLSTARAASRMQRSETIRPPS